MIRSFASTALAGCVALAMACTPSVSQDVKQEVSATAVQLLHQSQRTVQDGATLALNAHSLGLMLQVGDVSGFDISGLPRPESVTDSTTSSAALRDRALSMAPRTRDLTDGTIAGCVSPDPTDASRARWISCDATDHVDVSYANGDRVEYTYDSFGDSFTVRMNVISGNYAGSYMIFQMSWNNVYESVTINESGHLYYAETLLHPLISTQFDVQYEFASGTDVSARYYGDLDDLIRHRRVHSDITARLTDIPGDGSFTASWAGSARIAQLANSADAGSDARLGETGQDIVEWRNMNVTWQTHSSVVDYSETWTGSGDVLYNGTIVGHLEAQGRNGIVIVWSDGQTTPFDFSELLIVTPF